jgi:hypothetical protein
MKIIGRVVKIISTSMVAFLLACTLTGCQFTGYKGEFPALYTVAVNSLLAARGYHSHGDALLKLVEEDSYGRILFSYYEDSYYDEGWPNSFSYLICQKSDETYVYYYADYNFISKAWNGLDTPFSSKEIEELKTKNDWNKEFSDKELTKLEITPIKKEPGTEIERKDFDALFQKVAMEKGRQGNGTMVHPYVLYLTSDTYGRKLYFASAKHYDTSEEAMEFELVMIFNPDGSYNEEICVMELKDHYNYQDDLKEFKEQNNWNKPLE